MDGSTYPRERTCPSFGPGEHIFSDLWGAEVWHEVQILQEAPLRVLDCPLNRLLLNARGQRPTDGTMVDTMGAVRPNGRPSYGPTRPLYFLATLDYG